MSRVAMIAWANPGMTLALPPRSLRADVRLERELDKLHSPCEPYDSFSFPLAEPTVFSYAIEARVDRGDPGAAAAGLVVNARSRRGRHLYERARSGLAATGFTLLGTYPAHRAGEMERSLAAAAALGPDLLVVGGGDGTISAAARLLAHRDIALGLLPLGTTNNFARTVGIPRALLRAVRHGVLTPGAPRDGIDDPTHRW